MNISISVEKSIKKILYSVFFGMLIFPFFVFAQYDQNAGTKSSVNISPVTSNLFGGIIRTIEILLGLLVAYIMLIVVIAGILFITSNGDENRMDTAIRWWKRSAIGLVLAPLTYMIINAVGDALGNAV